MRSNLDTCWPESSPLRGRRGVGLLLGQFVFLRLAQQGLLLKRKKTLLVGLCLLSVINALYP